jgi:hypothetical protein
MKNLFTFLFVALIGVASLFAQAPDEGDAAFVAGWTAPVPGWWPAVPATKPVKKQATCTTVSNFDAAGVNFDTEWAKIPGDGNVLGAEGSRLGLAGSEKGAADFTGSFKVVSDESNIYILLQYTDDDVTGEETVEVAWAPYDTINTPVLAALPQAWYARYQQFGAYKATFKKTGYDATMMVDGSTGGINWGGTNEILSANLYLDDHTTVGSKTVKQIITIGFAALTGEARPEFNQAIWKIINGGKGISLDMKVNDKDGDDALKADASGTAPAEYWWSTTNNDCWAITAYAGYLSAPAFDPSSGDAAFVAGWTAPVPGWWPAVPATRPLKKQASAAKVSNFDAAGVNFDAEWAKISGDGNVLGAEGSRLGLAGSEKGAADFTGSYKAAFDESNMYILLKYDDDDVTGEETVEVAWAPYDTINVPVLAALPQAWYARYQQFGAYKATFKKTGYDATMMVDGSTGGINWGGTNDILSANLYLDDHTTVGSKTVKQIITIGFAALTGEARPDFNAGIWATLNDGKGISLDMKVNDKDGDDAMKADASGTAPAEYWWSTTNNDCWAITAYAGYLNTKGSITSIKPPRSEASIFGKTVYHQVLLNRSANVAIFNIMGQQLKLLKNVNQVDLSEFRSGVYIIRANNEVKKFFR